MASASGVLNFLRQLSLGFGTSFATTLWDDRTSFHDHRLNSHVTPFEPATQQWLDQAQSLGMTSDQAHRQLADIISNQALMMATNDLFYISGWVFLGLMLLIWFARPAHRH
ncbi:hypothetical protein [Kushneria phosphatilytica]|uniref:hypothetical protein n=1 Tax=Kushneria phosphatilytica TaxID=657387 RepID=UPI00197F3073|nr:hypothetical protein [Kushneria phosphatilytica]